MREIPHGVTLTNSHGRVIQDFMPTTEFSLLSTNEPTHIHVQTGTLTNIDLAITSADVTDFTWSPCDDQHGSDHFQSKFPKSIINHDSYEFHKADWKEKRKREIGINSMMQQF